MRELRGAGVVKVKHVPTDINPADLFTKVLGRQPFERHRHTVVCAQPLAAQDAIESMRAARAKYGESASKETAAFAAGRVERYSSLND